MKKYVLLILFILIGISVVQGQGRRVTGTVTSGQDGSTLPGVAVVVKGTTIGVNTNVDGYYSINIIGEEATLGFSYIGMESQEVKVTQGRDVYDVILQPAVVGLGDVVVTALGISRERKALGYAAQELSGDELTKAPETNIVNSLSGKTAGVYINSSGGNVGASSRIIIRGNSSLRDDNQPLFVVDGIPITNRLTRLGGSNVSNDFGNSAADINPADIEDITVLKGANAAALYGSRGANGVILITTKSGSKKGFSVELESTTTFSTPLVLPEYQNQYGQGDKYQYAYKDGLNGGIMDGVDESFGPKLDYIVKQEDIQLGGDLYWTVGAGIPQTVGQILQLPQFNSPIDPATGKRTPTPWISRPDNIKNFFETGILAVNNISIGNGGEWGNLRLSLSNSNQKGMIPNTDQKKNTVNFSGKANLSKKLSFEVRSSYMNIHSDNLTGAGYSSNNPMQQTVWGGRQVDWDYLKDNILRPDGSQVTWISRYHDNPYFLQYYMLNPMTRNRLIGSAILRYQLTDWLNVQLRAGTDYSGQKVERQWEQGSVNAIAKFGRFEVHNTTDQEINADFLISASKSVSEDIVISGNIGGNIMNSKYSSQSSEVAKLVVPSVFSVANAAEPAITDYYRSEKEIQSLYASASFEWRKQIYVDLTGRNDWSSTLPSHNNSYFYPSATTSWIFSETFGFDEKILSFGKIRLGWAQVGNDAGPYRLSQVYNSAQPFGSDPSFSLGSTLPPLDLKNELIESTEIGVDLRFFDHRLGLDLTLYKSSARNQILNVDLSNATGYSAMAINAGQIDNKGIEVILTGTPVQKKDFSWDVTVNWSKNQNKVIALSGELGSYELYRIFNQWITVIAPVGGEYGTMMGNGYVRDDNGNIVVNSNGIPLQEYKKVGNIMPDWIGSISNRFSYKGLGLSVFIDMKKGGNIFSRTNWNGWQTGVLATSVGLNDKGGNLRDPVSENGGFCFGGVFQDGTPNNIYLDFQANRYNPAARSERWTYDASYIKLREVALSYSLPKSLISKLSLRDAEISVFGRNLAILHKNILNVDPEASVNDSSLSSQGGEHASIPTPRNIGFRLKLNF
jgi:TonB-linked SusC/RagA family outer membrane protein